MKRRAYMMDDVDLVGMEYIWRVSIQVLTYLKGLNLKIII